MKPLLFIPFGKPYVWAKTAQLCSRSLPLVHLMRERSASSTTRKVLHRVSQVMAGSVVVFSTATIAHSVNQCPYTGRWRLSMTSPEEDIDVGNKLSHSIISSVQSELVLPRSHPLTRICQQVVDRIVVGANVKSGGFKIIIISDSQVNAISLPNGDIIVHAGLIGSVRNEDELAGVLAHEMAHTILRHSSEVVVVSDIARIPSGFLYSAAFAAGGSGIISAGLRWLAMKLAQPERLLADLPVSRKVEAEADKVGMSLMAESGFDPESFVEYWSRQAGTDQLGSRNILSTHPHSSDRLKHLLEQCTTLKPVYSESKDRHYFRPWGKPAKRRGWWSWISGSSDAQEEESTLPYWIDRINSQLE